MHAKGKYRENFGPNGDFWWMLLALKPQMMTMLLKNSSGAPVIASSIKEIDEIVIRKLHLVMTTIACGHKNDAQKFKEFCLAPAKFATWPSVDSYVLGFPRWESRMIEEIQSRKDKSPASNFLKELRIFLKWSKH
ncbi:hypothetical protein TNIN_397791 [Trichonephila inaurata madagascariensis]|uniref:Uncharacterized protein n=1 Tax=Trichonephila inaurata madagascariensis TaxID=2747483 RepID=A0A8X6I8F4_9ARAC|nr:hypothetical protein TNIN_397791 [Trichonephila inaurata madagascariensis]